jgi:hypothetical protein
MSYQGVPKNIFLSRCSVHTERDFTNLGCLLDVDEVADNEDSKVRYHGHGILRRRF